MRLNLILTYWFGMVDIGQGNNIFIGTCPLADPLWVGHRYQPHVDVDVDEVYV